MDAICQTLEHCEIPFLSCIGLAQHCMFEPSGSPSERGPERGP